MFQQHSGCDIFICKHVSVTVVANTKLQTSVRSTATEASVRSDWLGSTFDPVSLSTCFALFRHVAVYAVSRFCSSAASFVLRASAAVKTVRANAAVGVFSPLGGVAGRRRRRSVAASLALGSGTGSGEEQRGPGQLQAAASCLSRRQRDGHMSDLLTSAPPYASGSGQGSTWGAKR